jgi:hypothetical protein
VSPGITVSFTKDSAVFQENEIRCHFPEWYEYAQFMSESRYHRFIHERFRRFPGKRNPLPFSRKMAESFVNETVIPGLDNQQTPNDRRAAT